MAPHKGSRTSSRPHESAIHRVPRGAAWHAYPTASGRGTFRRNAPPRGGAAPAFGCDASLRTPSCRSGPRPAESVHTPRYLNFSPTCRSRSQQRSSPRPLTGGGGAGAAGYPPARRSESQALQTDQSPTLRVSRAAPGGAPRGHLPREEREKSTVSDRETVDGGGRGVSTGFSCLQPGCCAAEAPGTHCHLFRGTSGSMGRARGHPHRAFPSRPCRSRHGRDVCRALI